MINEIRFWKEKILFRDGWYIFTNGEGDYSIISESVAKKKVSDYNAYQASQDVSRGGIDPDIAYPSRGFQKINGEYVYMRKEAEELATGPIRNLSETLVIPETVGEFTINYICKEAFFGEEQLKKVILHPKIKTIEYKAFYNCINLTTVDNVPEWITIAQEVFTNTRFFNDEPLHYLGHVLVKAEPTCTGKIEIKEGTHAISNDAFQECTEITEVILPEGLRKIGNSSFYKCSNLEHIQFPHEMDYIGDYAFKGCTKLNHVRIPQGIEILRRDIFCDCESLSDIEFPSNIRSIGYNAFQNTAYMNSFMESEKFELYINNWLIHYKSNEYLTLNVKEGTIGIADRSSIRWNDTWKRAGAILPNTLKYLGRYSLSIINMDKIMLPDSLLIIGSSAFSETKIKEIVIPSSVKKIDEHTFTRCESLEKVVIEGKDTEIIWPAITDRRDKKSIQIVALPGSSAHEYCKKYGEKYHLKFININM